MYKEVTSNSVTGRAVGFLLNPPPLGSAAAHITDHAYRLAAEPITRLAGMTRANAYFLAGCPLDRCEASAARDVWNHCHGVE